MLSPAEFARTPRIIGTETEYSHLANDAALKKMGVAPSLNDQFKPNGARLYKDVADIVEYATPECLGPREAVLYERAGEVAVWQLDKSEVHKRLIAAGAQTITRPLPRTAGHHENYASLRFIDDEEVTIEQVAAAMVAHCTSRIAFNGAGLVATSTSGKHFFSIGQKVWGIGQVTHSGTTNATKPIFNTKDEPHSRVSEYRRVHVVPGDANMCDYASWLTLATTSLVLRLVEAGEDLSHLVPVRPIVAMRDWSINPLSSYRTESGSSMNALDVQESVATLVEKLGEDVELPEDEVEAIHEWRTTCDQLRNNPDELIGKVDWVTKRELIRRKLGTDIITPDTLGAAISIDLAYDNLDTGYAERLRRNGGIVTFFTQHEIERAMVTPPNTRAKQRSDLVEELKPEKVNWAGVQKNGKLYQLDDPYGIQQPKIVRL